MNVGDDNDCCDDGGLQLFEGKLSHLELQISQSPYDKELFDEVIELLSCHIDQSDLASKLSLYRQQYMHRFTTKSSFWSNWLSDEMILTSVSATHSTPGSSSSVAAADATTSPRNNLLDLFDLALSRCPTLDVVLMLVEYSKQLLDEDASTELEHRKRLEKAVGIIGGDVYSGLIAWRALIEFECDELEDLVEISAPSSEIQAVKKTISQLCHKLLSNPLANLDEALQFVSEVFENVMLETDEKLIQPEIIQKKYNASVKASEARLTFESYIGDATVFGSKSEGDRCKTWRAYADFEIKDGNLTRAQRIFDRAMYDCDTSIDLLTAYMSFARHEVKNWSLVKLITERSFAICYNSTKFWKLRLVALENLNEDFGLVTSTFDQAVCCGLPTASDYLTIFLMKCDYINRFVIQLCRGAHDENDEGDNMAEIRSALSTLKASFQQIETFLDSYYQTWMEGWIIYVNHRIQTEHFLMTEVGIFLGLGDSSRGNNSNSSNSSIKGSSVTAAGGGGFTSSSNSSSDNSQFNLGVGSNSDIKSVFESLLTRFPKEAPVWKLYIEWSKVREASSSTRKIFKRAVSQVTSERDVELLYREWLQFESIFGIISDILSIGDKIDAMVEKREREVDRGTVEAEKESLAKAATAATAKSASQGKTSESLSKRKLTADDSNSSSSSSTAIFAENKKAKDDKAANLINTETKASSNDTFSNNSYGNINDDSSNNNHLNENSNNESSANSSSITSSITASSSASSFPLNPKLADADRHYTVFVNKVSKSTTEEDLKTLVSSCGEILAVKVNVDKTTGLGIGSGMVQFKSLEGRQAALKLCNKVNDKEGNVANIQPSKYPVIIPKAVTDYSNNKRIESIASTVNLIKSSMSQNNNSSSSSESKPNPYLSSADIGTGGGVTASKPRSAGMFKPRSVALQSSSSSKPPDTKAT